MSTDTEDMCIEKRRRLIQGINALPSAPFILNKVLECIDNPRSCADDLKQLILQDQALTAKVLSFSNSAYFGFPQRISDVTNAIVVVGFETIMELTVGLSLKKGFADTAGSNELKNDEFWKYSLASAEAAKLVAHQTRYAHEEQAYIIGLLHDLGKLVLLNVFGEEYGDVLFDCRMENSTLLEKEMDVFGFDHAQTGQWLAEKWKLPENIAKTIALHHMSAGVPPEHESDIAFANIAEYMVRTEDIGFNGEVLEPEIFGYARNLLSKHKVDSAKLCTDFHNEKSKLDAIFASILK